MIELFVWPLTVFAIVVFVCLFFQGNIRGFFDRAKSIKLPGGFHAEGPEPGQQQVALAEAPLPDPTRLPKHGDAPAPVEQLGGTLRDPVLDPIEADARTRIEQNVPDRRFHMDWALRLMATAVVQRDNEQTYRLILGSQIRALKLIAQHGGRTKKDAIYAVYVGAVTQHEEQYKGFSFEAWYNFLITRELIVEELGEIVALTPRGYSFLTYMPLAGLSEAKLF